MIQTQLPPLFSEVQSQTKIPSGVTDAVPDRVQAADTTIPLKRIAGSVASIPSVSSAKTVARKKLSVEPLLDFIEYHVSFASRNGLHLQSVDRADARREVARKRYIAATLWRLESPVRKTIASAVWGIQASIGS